MTETLSTATLTLEAKVQLLLDEREITRVLLALARTVDQKDFDGLAALYAVDGKLITGRGTHQGRAGLAEYVAKDIGNFAALHHVGAGHEIYVQPNGRTATARMTLHSTHVTDAATMAFVTVGGYYDVQLVVEEGNWRLKEVHIHPQWLFNCQGQDTEALGWLADEG